MNSAIARTIKLATTYFMKPFYCHKCALLHTSPCLFTTSWKLLHYPTPAIDLTVFYPYHNYSESFHIEFPPHCIEQPNPFFNTYYYFDKSIVVAQSIYLTGTRAPFNDCISFASLNLPLLKLAKMAAMIVKKTNQALCEHRNYIYSVGGTEIYESGECEKYSIKNDKWESLPTLNQFRLNCSAVANNSTIYAICGGMIKKSRFANTIEALHEGSNQWKTINPINRKQLYRYNAVASLLRNDEILICGGLGNTLNTQKCEKISIDNDKYKVSTDSFLIHPANFAFNNNGTHIYSQYYCTDNIDRVHCYNKVHRTWILMS